MSEMKEGVFHKLINLADQFFSKQVKFGLTWTKGNVRGQKKNIRASSDKLDVLHGKFQWWLCPNFLQPFIVDHTAGQGESDHMAVLHERLIGLRCH